MRTIVVVIDDDGYVVRSKYLGELDRKKIGKSETEAMSSLFPRLIVHAIRSEDGRVERQKNLVGRIGTERLRDNQTKTRNVQ